MAQFNLTEKLDEILDTQSMADAINGVDTTASLPTTQITDISSSFTPARQQEALDNLAAVESDPLFNPAGNPIVSQQTLNSVTTLYNTLSALRTSVNTGSFDYNPVIADLSTSPRPANDVAQYQGELLEAMEMLNNIFLNNDAQLSQIEANRDNIKSTITALKTSVSNVMTLSLSTSSIATNTISILQTGAEASKGIAVQRIPELKSQLVDSGNEAIDILKAGTKCDKLANDFDIIQVSLCTSIL